MQLEKQKEKAMNTNEQNFSDVWDTMKLTCIKYSKVNTEREREGKDKGKKKKTA